ncbi:MAG: cation transporter [Propionicimonas sp.]
MISTYTVTGMTCGHCVKAIKEEVGGIPGVTGVELALEGGALTVHSEAPIDFDRIVEAVYEAGEEYSVA